MMVENYFRLKIPPCHHRMKGQLQEGSRLRENAHLLGGGEAGRKLKNNKLSRDSLNSFCPNIFRHHTTNASHLLNVSKNSSTASFNMFLNLQMYFSTSTKYDQFNLKYTFTFLDNSFFITL
jgi:hypothetical protein